MKTNPGIEVSRKGQGIFLALALLIAGGLSARCAQPSSRAPEPGSRANAAESDAQPPIRNGSHDFDFLYGKWRMPNHRLVKRLAGSHEWADFISCDEATPLPGGLGDMDVYRTNYWKDFVGVTVRTYDPNTGLWCLYWVDSQFSHGEFDPPVVGKFEGNVGVFLGKATFNEKPILMRFTWTINPKGSEVVAKWNQAFSPDDGKTWETNWYNELIRDDHCNPI